MHLLVEAMLLTFINSYSLQNCLWLNSENEGNLHFQFLSDLETRPESKDSTSVQDFSKEESGQVGVKDRLTRHAVYDSNLGTTLECENWLENQQENQERHLREMFTHMNSLPAERTHEHGVYW